VEPATWFATITAKIDAMKLIEDQLATDIAANAGATDRQCPPRPGRRHRVRR
jgi:hypothetical protein